MGLGISYRDGLGIISLVTVQSKKEVDVQNSLVLRPGSG